MQSIQWPAGYVPGFTDNFCSNEVIVSGLSVAQIWPLLVSPALWPTYYSNSANPRIYDSQSKELALHDRFYFETFGFPVEAEVVELIAPVPGQPARIAWHGWAGESESRLDVHHAWLLEDLPEGRVRILTQETQNGAPAKELARTVPNPMINGHQQWLDGMVSAALAANQ
ncbi:SRPBCC domain-containing protein [Rheinheimera texasensis]|uniref:SRPBCC domain-containing protein n=1 Tax=Rheinheimera texasensis TaxID=306205 RepID=UPI0004E21AE3|nr:SRPBCC domain-containing protein [Rheinheimera texasensis]